MYNIWEGTRETESRYHLWQKTKSRIKKKNLTFHWKIFGSLNYVFHNNDYILMYVDDSAIK